MQLDLDARVKLVERNTSELITHEELRALLSERKTPTAYVGFEPSGLLHIGQGVICASKLKDLTQAGFNVIILLADWHAFINDKLGSSLENIKACGKYMEDCFLALGVDKDKTKFVYASELVGDARYWEKVIKIAKCFSLARVKRSMTIMGRAESDADLDSSKLIYPAMQCADIFELDVDIAYGGMDQRKAHMLAREAADKLSWKKPIALHTPLLSGLLGKERMETNASSDIKTKDETIKMSKSKPENCIFIHDSPEQISTKIRNVYCPPNVTEDNPVIAICRHILLPSKEQLVINRKEQPAVEVTADNLESLYSSGAIHPLDLKSAVSGYLAELLAPARDYSNKKPASLEKLLEILKELRQ